MKSSLFLILSTILFSGYAKADLSKSVLFSLNTIYLDRDYDNNGIKSKAKETDTDLRLLYITKHWAFGGIYSLSANDSSDSSRSSYGVSGGYFSEKDFYLAVHYFFASKYNFGGGTEYTKGNGYGIDLGFLSKITSSFYAGLVFAHRNFTYTEQTSMTGVTSVNSSHKELIPMFSFAVVFQ